MQLLTGWGVYGVWAGLSALFLGVMCLPATPPRRSSIASRASWCWRLVRGDMAVDGTLRTGVGVGAALWWCGAAGIVVSDTVRVALVLLAGGGLLIALLNAGRRAELSGRRRIMLAVGLGMGSVMLLLVGEGAWLTT